MLSNPTSKVGIFCSIVKFRISWTYYRETLSWAKFTIVTALVSIHFPRSLFAIIDTVKNGVTKAR